MNKKRYEYHIYSGCECYQITDTKTRNYLDIEDIIKLANEQDQTIVELGNALELACKHIENFSGGCYYCPRNQYENNTNCEFDSGKDKCIEWLIDYFKTKVKQKLKENTECQDEN